MIARIRSIHSVIRSACALLLLIGIVDFANGADSVSTIAVSGGHPIAAKVDAQGVVHLLLQAATGPQYVQSTDDGKTFSRPLPVVDANARKPGLEFSVWDMCVSPQGHVHVAMGTNGWKLKLPQEEWAFFYARLDPGASAFTPTRNINRQPSEGFSLAASDNGVVTACWLSGKLYASVSRDNGDSFSPGAELNPDWNPCDCCTTSAAYGADGRLAILYREETNNQRDMFLVLWDQGNNKLNRTPISRTLWKIDACPMSYYSVSRRANGYLAVWPTKGQVYFTRLNADGSTQAPPEIKTPGTTGMRTGMLALNSNAGITCIAWKKDNQLGWQLYNQRGEPMGSPEFVHSAGKGVAGVLAKNGQFVLFR